jgi:hypothetical protein
MTEPVVLGHVEQLVLTWRAQQVASVLQRLVLHLPVVCYGK